MNVIEFNNRPHLVACKSAEAHSPLTAREEQVLRLAYLTNKEIGCDLGISENTVRAFFRQIATKWKTRSRTEAYAAWLEAPCSRRSDCEPAAAFFKEKAA